MQALGACVFPQRTASDCGPAPFAVHMIEDLPQHHSCMGHCWRKAAASIAHLLILSDGAASANRAFSGLSCNNTCTFSFMAPCSVPDMTMPFPEQSTGPLQAVNHGTMLLLCVHLQGPVMF